MIETATETKGLTRIVGIAEMIVTTDPREILITYSLGSCIGVTVYDPQLKIGGLIHCMLPSSKLEESKAQAKPHMFVDTGMVDLLQTVMNLGADKKRLIVKVAGAASPMDACGRFKIGERNHTTLRKILWKNEIMLKGEDVGGTLPRTMSLYLGDGRTTIRSSGQEVNL
jgi:chemotaxis protein CheD